ncbi:MAG TPA: penicillin-binding protein 1A [Rhizomicrobium sp.]|nr:penicillin-binding protein 1A [Rhizomicrobium sp.]
MARNNAPPKKNAGGGDGGGASDYNAPRKAPPKRKRSWPYAIAILLAWGLIFGAIGYSRWISTLPDTTNLLARGPSRDITLYDDQHRLITQRGLTHSAMVDVTQLPPHVANAFIAIEDRRFRSHFGVDPIGMGRAFYENMHSGHVVQGGSTLTQQLAKNLFLKPDRTFDRKVQELALAIYLESRYTKDQILTLYLNRVYFGAGVYGIEAAAEHFFGKSARELNLTEAAMLAGSVKAPAKYNPLSDPDASIQRGTVVLRAMVKAGFISEAQRADAVRTHPRLVREKSQDSGYFVDWVISQIPSYIGDVDQPIVVETTFDAELQAQATRALRNGLAQDGPALEATEGALVAMTPDGAVRAVVGGRSYAVSTFNRATDARRQPGSAFKPFVYLTAFEHGRSPSDTMVDGPFSIGKWKPGNYEGRYEGAMTLTHAFAKSSNSIAAQLTQQVGPGSVLRTARRLGITSDLMAVPAIALGVFEVSPLELTAAYTPFANGGDKVLPYAIVRIMTKDGQVLYERKGSSAGRAMSPEHAAEMANLMTETVTTGTGKAARLEDRPTAGKTGTTQDFRDAWFVGFTSDLVCGVWIGNDNNKSMKHATGGGLPARIFHSFMVSAENGLPVRPLAALANQAAPAESTTSPTDAAPANGTDQPKKEPSTIDDIIDSLFGSGAQAATTSGGESKQE